MATELQRFEIKNEHYVNKKGHYLSTHKWTRGLRKKLLERDGKGCVICGSQMGVSIHHYWERKGDMKGFKSSPYMQLEEGKPVPKYDLNYLVLLCRSCHGKVHTAREETPFMQLFHQLMDSKRKERGK